MSDEFHDFLADKADYVEDVGDFKKRQFSGMDLLQFMESVGVGVGATMHTVRQAELQHLRHPDTYRALDGPGLDEQTVMMIEERTRQQVVAIMQEYIERRFDVGPGLEDDARMVADEMVSVVRGL